MEIVKNYLENMFMGLPKTKEVQRAKEELSVMMEDKYNELKAAGKTENEAVGIVISEFGNLEELAEELGIKNYVKDSGSETPKRSVSMEEIKKYIQDTTDSSFAIAIGVLLCICSPIVLIVLGGMKENGMAISDGLINVLGVSTLLVLVAIAVGIFIIKSMKLEKYNYLKEEILQLDFSVDSFLREQRDNNKGDVAVKIAVGVVLCIISVIPIICIGSAYVENELFISIAIGITLMIVSIAVLLFITVGMKEECYKILLQEGEYSSEQKKNKLTSIVASIYWPIIVCIYLAYNFITADWGRSWIVWPIAGVLFAAFASICNIVGKKE